MKTKSLVVLGLLSAFAQSHALEGYPVPLGRPTYSLGSVSAVCDASDDGRYVVFVTNTFIHPLANGQLQVYLRDTVSQQTWMVSQHNGVASNLGSSDARCSADGHKIVFSSTSSNLGFIDPLGFQDIFVFDIMTKNMDLVSSNVTIGNQSSYYPGISNNGRYVTFASSATNFVLGDVNGQRDIFKKDLVTGNVTLVSVNESGAQANGASGYSDITDDGDKVVFGSEASNLVGFDTNTVNDVFMRTISTNKTAALSRKSTGIIGNAISQHPRITPDGSYACFESEADNLVTTDTNGARDIFVRDLVNNTIEIGSNYAGTTQLSGNSYAGDISDSGTFVTFYTDSAGVGQPAGGKCLWSHNRFAGTGTFRARDANFNPLSGLLITDWPSNANLFNGGVFLNAQASGLPNDAPGNYDAYIWNLGRLLPVSASTFANGASSDPAVSDDGRWVTFASSSSNLVPNDNNGVIDIFLKDMDTGETSRVSENIVGGNAFSGTPTINYNGTRIFYSTFADNLVLGDTNGASDIMGWNSTTPNIPFRIVGTTGAQLNGNSLYPHCDNTGDRVVFESLASNFVGGDINGTWDIFLYQQSTDQRRRISVSTLGLPANGASFDPKISGDGEWVVFESDATNLVAGDTNGFRDIFVRELLTGITKRVSINGAGIQGNGHSIHPDISEDGKWVVFESEASNLVPGDVNGQSDIFAVHTPSGNIYRLSETPAGGNANGASTLPSITPDASHVTFSSVATNLHPADTGSGSTVYGVTFGVAGCYPVNQDSQGLVSQSTTELKSTLSGNSNVLLSECNAPTLSANQTPGDRTILAADVEANQVWGTAILGGPWLGKPVRLTIEVTNGVDTEVHTALVDPVSHQFRFGHSVVTGNVDFYVSGPTWLRKHAVEFGASVISATLTNGDCNHDNLVDIADYTILALGFDRVYGDLTFDARADLNGDGLVDIADYTILATSFDAVGD